MRQKAVGEGVKSRQAENAQAVRKNGKSATAPGV